MAEAVVEWAINKLELLLVEEVKLLRDVHREFEYIKDEVETIQSFLRDADARFYQETADSRIRTWVKQVRQVAFRIEDVADEYMLHVAWNQDDHGFLHKIPRFFKKLKAPYEIASKIEDIKKSIADIKERNDRYRFNFSSEQASNDRDRHNSWNPSLFVDAAELVGIESPKAELIWRLVEGTSKNVTISVVGMGGLGKTTLAKKVYDSESVTAHFVCKAWITVSQSYKMEDLLSSMMQQFKLEPILPAFNRIDDMIEKLREYLCDKRYLVVFDDVWGIDLWGQLRTLLPDNGKGSRIMISTRNEGVAPSPNECPWYHVHKLHPLPETEAYELFCKRVFQSNGGICPLQLQKLSHAIVEKCEGLPLAIVTIGGVLATKSEDCFRMEEI